MDAPSGTGAQSAVVEGKSLDFDSRSDPRLLWLFGVLMMYPALDYFLPRSLQIVPAMPNVLIFALIGLGLTVATGFTGLLHLGVAAFVAIGAYTFAILTCAIYPFQLPWVVAVVCAGLFGALAGAILAIPTIRLRGDYLAIVTLGFGEIVQDVLRNLEVITKGTQGINPLPGPDIGFGPIASANSLSWYYVALGIVGLAAFGLQRVVNSPIGRSWLAIRDDELAASCMGIDPVRVKLASFAVSAGLCAVGGALLVSYLQSSGEPSNYDFQVSIMVLSMVIVGGMGSISGSILGAIIMVGINSVLLAKLADWLASSRNDFGSNVFLSPGNWKYLIFGLALVLMMRFKSEGILPPIKEQRAR